MFRRKKDAEELSCGFEGKLNTYEEIYTYYTLLPDKLSSVVI